VIQIPGSFFISEESNMSFLSGFFFLKKAQSVDSYAYLRGIVVSYDNDVEEDIESGKQSN
jgi:hypothetical protein